MIRRVYGRGRGSIWTPSDFHDLGSRAGVDQALSRLTKEQRIHRLARGLYHYPEWHPVLGEIPPSVERIARALAGRDQVRLLPSGAYAANRLRLSEQVPARVVFLTDGPSRKVKVGNFTVELRHVVPKRVAAANRTSGLVIEAFRYIGRDRLTSDRIEALRELLSVQDREQLAKDTRLAPAWMQPFLRKVAKDADALAEKECR